MTSVEVSESLEGELAVQFVDRVRACDTSRASDVMASAASLLDSHQFVFDFVLPTVRALGDASYTQSISRAGGSI